MTANDKGASDMQTATVVLSDSDWQLRMSVSVPSGPMRLNDLLPLVRNLDDAIVQATLKSVEANGQKISCKRGCGACCRQLVAISTVDAQSLAELVAAMPPERQAVIRARFDQRVGRLEDAGLLDRGEPKGDRALVIKDCGSREASLQELSRRYFRLQMPCPFLEDESCSIYADRPMVCREYHVTSPAERCAKLFEQPVDRVEVPVRLGDVITRTAQRVNEMPAYSVPLVLALEWSEAHGESLQPCHDGMKMFEILMSEMLRGPELKVG
jgi:Fe-S-cluster containining protein